MNSLSLFYENGVYINVKNTVKTPKKDKVTLNPSMLVNRSLALCALGTYIEINSSSNKSMRCLDAFGATGIAGLSWAKKFPQLTITINDPSEIACSTIKENEVHNGLSVEITRQDVNVLLCQRSFDFIFLNCHGSSVHYLDSVFRNIHKNGILVITSTDDAALYGKAPDVTLRTYGSSIARTFYSKELASRLIISAVVRSAAKYNKGIEVLSSIAVKSHITLILRVTKSSAQATQCINQLRKVLHCCICEDRTFFPKSIHPVEHPYSLLSCRCKEKSSGHVAVELGPVWSGPIFDSDFCIRMLHQVAKQNMPQKIHTLLQTVVTESLGGNFKATNMDGNPRELASFESPVKSNFDPSKEELVKKRKTELCSPFYFNLHRHSPKGHDLGKLKKIIQFIQDSNYTASRTHFDPEAIRTSASLKEFDELLILFACNFSR